MRTAIVLPLLTAVAIALGADGDGKAPPRSIEHETEAMAFVREHHPELARLLEPLKARNPAEYRKAVGEIAQVARTLTELKGRNPRRAELALDAWKAKSRVELAAAQLAGQPGSEEARSQLRTAIEAKVDAEIRRQQFDLDQAEQAARKLRQSLDRLEKQRDAVVEARFRALQPKKARGREGDKAIAVPASPPPPPPTDRPRETRP